MWSGASVEAFPLPMWSSASLDADVVRDGRVSEVVSAATDAEVVRAFASSCNFSSIRVSTMKDVSRRARRLGGGGSPPSRWGLRERGRDACCMVANKKMPPGHAQNALANRNGYGFLCLLMTLFLWLLLIVVVVVVLVVVAVIVVALGVVVDADVDLDVVIVVVVVGVLVFVVVVVGVVAKGRSR